MRTRTNFLTAGMLLATLASGFGQPVITCQPQWRTNAVGSTAMFSVCATGAPPLFLQWRFNGADRAEATNATLVLTNVQTTNQGAYAVVVTEFGGLSVTSAVARLYVIVPPIITTQPTNFLTLSLGASVSNRVTASGTIPLFYQWRLNETNLPGQTNAVIVLTNLQSADVGDYTVLVTNIAGSTNSQVASLNVDPTFTKITAGSIVTDLNDYWNGSWADYDNDGYLDLFVGTWWNSTTNHLYHNNGDGTFTRVPAANIPKVPSNQHGATWGDYDNDGYVDLMVTAGNPQVAHNVIYRNNGNGTFTAITNGPIYDETYFDGFHSPSWVDYDNDGFLDLFVAGHAPQNRLWRNKGDGSFSKITNSIVVTDFVGESIGRTWVDYDNDGHVDLFVCNVAPYKNALYRNNGDATFTKITNSILTSTVDGSLACAWGDYDNDGYLDVFVANGYFANRPNSLYKNNGDGTFTKITQGDIVNDQVSGQFSGTCAWGDYDNDGYLDLIVGTGRYGITLGTCYLYRNNGDGTFTRITEGSPVNELGNAGAGWVDYDNDGFLDLFLANGGHWSEVHGPGALLVNFLYHNNGNSNNWITIRLVGGVSNRSAIGAKVRAKATIGGKTTWQVREIFGGDSQSNEQPLDAHFGLAGATNIDTVRIEWPSGTLQELHDVAVKQFLTMKEPPRLMSPRFTNGAFAFILKGGRGFQYGIERSTNAQNWMPAGSVTVTNLNGTGLFHEPVDRSAPTWLYRAVSP